jgi:hypothetical protein
MKYVGHVAYRALVRRSAGKRPLGRSQSGWRDNIKTVLQYAEWRGTNWIDLTQDRGRWRALVTAVTNLRLP